MSTSKPPRARSPWNRPSGQAFGSAGSSAICRVALQQHLGDPPSAEVAVDLERRVRVEQVRQASTCAAAPSRSRAPFAVFQARPEVDDPRAAPAGVSAAVRQAPLERLPGGRGQFRRAARRNLPPGCSAKSCDMWRCPGSGLLEVLRPFLNLSVLADCERRQPSRALPPSRGTPARFPESPPLRITLVNRSYTISCAHGGRDIESRRRPVGR